MGSPAIKFRQSGSGHGDIVDDGDQHDPGGDHRRLGGRDAKDVAALAVQAFAEFQTILLTDENSQGKPAIQNFMRPVVGVGRRC